MTTDLYNFTNVRQTAEGGRVSVGVDIRGNAHLHHEIGRTTETMSLGAIGAAVAAGTVPVDAVVGAFRKAGTLALLAEAVNAEVIA